MKAMLVVVALLWATVALEAAWLYILTQHIRAIEHSHHLTSTLETVECTRLPWSKHYVYCPAPAGTLQVIK